MPSIRLYQSQGSAAYRTHSALFDEFVPWMDKKAVAADLKAIYGTCSLEIAEANLEHFDEVWSDEYPHVDKFWRNNWEDLTVFFEYPKDIRKVI